MGHQGELPAEVTQNGIKRKKEKKDIKQALINKHGGKMVENN